MPSLSHEVEGEGDGKEFLCIATFLPIRKWSQVIPFLRMTSRVQKQLNKTEGLVRYGLKTNLPRKHFWTFTVWRDRKFVDAFTDAHPHSEAVDRFKDWAGEGAAFVEYTSANGSIDWDTGLGKLQKPTFYYKR